MSRLPIFYAALLSVAGLACEEGAPDLDPQVPDLQEVIDNLPEPPVVEPPVVEPPVVEPPVVEPPVVEPPVVEPPVVEPPDPVEVEMGEGTEVELTPPPPAPEVIEPTARPRRRMNIDQLEAAMLQVSGGQAWTEGNREESLFQTLSATLGKPDYVQITYEDLEPTALFQKFLDDASRQVCQKIITRDLDTADANERVLLRHVSRNDTVASNLEAIDANLQYLLRRWHGQVLDIESPALSGWRWLFESSVFVTGEPLDGWNAVCVGLFLSPDFYTY